MSRARPNHYRNYATRNTTHVREAVAIRNKVTPDRIKVDPRSLVPNGRSMLVFSAISNAPRDSRAVLEKVAEEVLTEAGTDCMQGLIVAVLKQAFPKAASGQTEKGKSILCNFDKLSVSAGRPGGAKTEPQILQAMGTAQNVVAELLDRDLKKEVASSLAMPRDQEGRTIFYNNEAKYFYVLSGQDGSFTETRVDVFVEMRPHPAGLCTVDFPTGMIPVLLTVLQAALKAK